MGKYLLFEKKESIGILTFNRPEKLNSLNIALLKEFDEFITSIEKESIQILVLIGSGDKAFIAGADIKEMAGFTNEEFLQFIDLGQKITLNMEHSKIIFIAAVNGFALGGGFEMALACDLIYASTDARFGLPEVKLGIISGFGGTQRLSRLIGKNKASELIYTGKIISGDEAFRLGIVNRLVNSVELKSSVIELSSLIIKNSPLALKQAKKSINYGFNISITEALELEKQICSFCFASHDKNEGINAFIEKRIPNFHKDASK